MEPEYALGAAVQDYDVRTRIRVNSMSSTEWISNLDLGR